MLTEDRNSDTLRIDEMTPLEIVTAINREDRGVARAVSGALPKIAEAVEGIVQRLSGEGRLFYIGAGTSGRLGVLDAAECPPTFGVDPRRVQGVLAGGPAALAQAVEQVEDDDLLGQKDLRERGVTAKDAVLGVSASGRTPYTLGALRWARRMGAFAVALSCNQEAPLSREADVAIEIPVGPEVISGSTRMKAGTAQKMVLNMISTAVMVRLGCVYSNLMVNIPLSNRKLIERGIRIVAEAAGVPRKLAQQTLESAGDVRSAILMLKLDCGADEARGLVSQSERLSEILRGA